MQICEEPKTVKKLHKDCQFVDNWGRQFKSVGLHLYLYRCGRWIPLTSWSDYDYPIRLWRISDES